MGNYVFDATALVNAVTEDSVLSGSTHDMGGDIVPAFVARGESGVYDFRGNEVPGSTGRERGYWRDVGTLASYYAAHMDVVAPMPVFSLYNYDWPVLTSYGAEPPAKVVRGDRRKAPRVDDSLLSPGVVVSGARVSQSVLSPAVRVLTGADISGSVLMNGVQVGEGAVIRNAIVDKIVTVPPGARIGVDPHEDQARGFVVEDGLTIVGKGQAVPRDGRSGGQSRTSHRGT
jgi:glucose-1-phosphate adenylyltransferase